MDNSAVGQDVLIMGCSCDIGYAASEAFLQEGSDVTVVGTKKSSVEKSLDDCVRPTNPHTASTL